MKNKDKLKEKELKEIIKEAYEDEINYNIDYTKNERILKRIINVNQINISNLRRDFTILLGSMIIAFTFLLILILVI